jgi:hypothetical protein
VEKKSRVVESDDEEETQLKLDKKMARKQRREEEKEEEHAEHKRREAEEAKEAKAQFLRTQLGAGGTTTKVTCIKLFNLGLVFNSLQFII